MNAVQRAILSAIIEHPGDCAGVSVPVLKEVIARAFVELDEMIGYKTEFLTEIGISDDSGARARWVQCGTCEYLVLSEDYDDKLEICHLCAECGMAADPVTP